jgi:hypothetical protein
MVGWRGLALVASVVAALVVPAAVTFLVVALGGAG